MYRRKTEQKRKSFTVYSVYVYIYIFIDIFIVKLALFFLFFFEPWRLVPPLACKLADWRWGGGGGVPSCLPSLPVTCHGGGGGGHGRGEGGVVVVVWPPQIRATPRCAAPSPDTKVNVKLFSLLKRLDTETEGGGGIMSSLWWRHPTESIVFQSVI